eukprot:NODE_618_length_2009_cov_25.301807_g574_i0.p1 GENE.NODE_618_length_2009_cov_25.301807_g574_i0~~NODE_618_length_2009_cov_25.301807_g574_i0.p1  ORF type:complete len:611 (-),score=145.15 NODE_618_length_2009_cov_25.301807_g574_i0:126-1958(-)
MHSIAIPRSRNYALAEQFPPLVPFPSAFHMEGTDGPRSSELSPDWRNAPRGRASTNEMFNQIEGTLRLVKEVHSNSPSETPSPDPLSPKDHQYTIQKTVVPKRQPSGTAPKPNTPQSAARRIADKLNVLRHNGYERIQLADRIATYQKETITQQSSASHLHRNIVETSRFAPEEKAKRAQEAQALKREQSLAVKERKQQLHAARQQHRVRLAYKYEIKLYESHQDVTQSHTQELVQHWLVWIVTALHSQHFHHICLKHSVVSKVRSKHQRAIAFVKRRMAEKVAGLHTAHVRTAWRTWRLHWCVYRLWIPVKRKKEAILMLRDYLAKLNPQTIYYKAARHHRLKVVAIQRFWRAARDRGLRFFRFVALQFLNEESALIKEEIGAHRKVVQKVDDHMTSMSSASHKQTDRVIASDLLPMSPGDRRRQKYSTAAAPPAAHRSTTFADIIATEDELALFNHRREKVPSLIRTLQIQSFYRHKQRELVEQRRQFQTLHEQHRVKLQLREFEQTVKNAFQPGLPGRPVEARHSSSSEENLVSPHLRLTHSREEIRSLIYASRKVVIRLLQAKRAQQLQAAFSSTHILREMATFKEGLLNNHYSLSELRLLLPSIG